MAVTFEEIGSSPQETLTRESFSAVRRLKVAWADRHTLKTELLGDDYPLISGTNAICTSASSVPILAQNKGTGSVSSFDYAIVTASYEVETIELNYVGERTSISIEPKAEFLTIGARNLRWTNNAGSQVRDEESPGLLMVGFDYIIEKQNIQTLDRAVVQGLIGHVNKAAVKPTARGLENWAFPAETLLFNPPSIQRITDALSVPRWNVTYRLTYKPNIDTTVTPNVERGWNYFWRADAATGIAKFDAMFIASGAQYKPYPPGDFTGVL